MAGYFLYLNLLIDHSLVSETFPHFHGDGYSSMVWWKCGNIGEFTDKFTTSKNFLHISIEGATVKTFFSRSTVLTEDIIITEHKPQLIIFPYSTLQTSSVPSGRLV